jgi:hypothetical protein
MHSRDVKLDRGDIYTYGVKSEGVDLDEDVIIANMRLGDLENLETVFSTVNSNSNCFHRHSEVVCVLERGQGKTD